MHWLAGMYMPAKKKHLSFEIPSVVLPLVMSVFIGCGIRPVNVNSEGGQNGGENGLENKQEPPVIDPPASQIPDCKYSEGNCDFNAECGDGEFCDGAIHTVGTPHEFACRGLCKPKAYPLCDPSLENPLSAKIEYSQSDKRLHLLVTNLGCEPVYRLEGCCGESSPKIETRVGDGKWGELDYSFPGPCCDAEPVCYLLEPLATRDIPLLVHLNDCEQSVRATAYFTSDSSCSLEGSLPWITVEATRHERDCD
jgi:hypothetical protein